jgi:hypothetical protein
LNVIVARLCFANSTWRPRAAQLNGDGALDLTNPVLHADGEDVAEVWLRRGRPNGGPASLRYVLPRLCVSSIWSGGPHDSLFDADVYSAAGSNQKARKG